MLPTLEIPQSRAQGKGRPLTTAEADAIQRAVDHAFGLYRLVLNGLGVDPLAGLPEQINTDTSGDGGVLKRVKLSGRTFARRQESMLVTCRLASIIEEASEEVRFARARRWRETGSNPWSLTESLAFGRKKSVER
jgi:hypothetical protein